MLKGRTNKFGWLQAPATKLEQEIKGLREFHPEPFFMQQEEDSRSRADSHSTRRKWGIHRIVTIGQRDILQQKGEWAASVAWAPP
jgi:hypothetical protein